MQKKVLMVCLGNICRSPVADGLLRQKVADAGLDVTVDSCGTSNYHIGESPDARSQENASKNGLDISMLRGRQFTSSDLDEFDHIYVMDKSNRDNVLTLALNLEHRDKVQLILDLTHPGEEREVPDPYYGGAGGFQHVYDLLDSACEVIVEGFR